jgi:hypothetical protein
MSTSPTSMRRPAAWRTTDEERTASINERLGSGAVGEGGAESDMASPCDSTDCERDSVALSSQSVLCEAKRTERVGLVCMGISGPGAEFRALWGSEGAGGTLFHPASDERRERQEAGTLVMTKGKGISLFRDEPKTKGSWSCGNIAAVPL